MAEANGAVNNDSDSEEDLDYNPTTKEIAEADREEQRLKRHKPDAHDEDLVKAKQASAKVEGIWHRLKSSGTAGSSTKFSYAAISAGSRASDAAQLPASEREWMRQYGITTVVPEISVSLPKTKSIAQQPGGAAALQESTDRQAPAAKNGLSDRALDIGLAARALALAKGGSCSTAAEHGDKVAVTEVRRFAGKDVLVSKLATKEEAAALKQKEAERQSGLDSVLASLQGTKKVTVMDKSRDDWGTLKKSDAQLEEELEAYKKSNDKYLDKVDFLKRSELREYEAERDQRLQNDMRTRGRT